MALNQEYATDTLVDAVPGTPLDAAAPVLSSVRCELSITDRAGS